uniref:Uncharacterized protein n=1 Tax=Candidatus Kentrum sp. SD TaxID=2126332 RepID=A0A450Y4K5_9GAMM|nr:MAG: hypothetical protein BECKSD772F_GA0070984_100217 [Candidatus Kentron sp. SD]
MSGEQLKFIDYRKPGLEAGDYIFTIQHTHGDPSKAAQTQETGKIKVRAHGDRVRIPPDRIFAQYPPPGERGDYDDTLAHISLNKPTLPWERSAYGGESYEPWLYLMVLSDGDVARGDAKRPGPRRIDDDLDQDAFIPAGYQKSLEEDNLIDKTNPVTTVDVRKSFFNKMIADRKEDLEYLAHVRQRWETDDENRPTELKRELAVLIANRFAQSDNENYPQGMRNWALLVSLEGYLDSDSGLDGCPDDQYIRFVVLTHWWFTATPVKVNFEQRSQALDTDALRLPEAKREEVNEESGFRDRLDAGLTAIEHEFRLGDRSVSWYRGPCIPFASEATGSPLLGDRERGIDDETPTATDADRLLRYHPEDGMFDISYASAYELGRFLSLRNPDYLRALYHYKHGRARYVRLEREDEDRERDVIEKGIRVKHLPYAKLQAETQAEYLRLVKGWLRELALLKGIPLWYLLPDPALLPMRALRLFGIDRKWIQSLWLGALSLGGRVEVTDALFGEIVADQDFNNELPRCGAFLRSDIVWAYPEQVVEIKKIPKEGQTGALDLKTLRSEKGNDYTDYIKGFPSLPLARKETLASDLLLCLSAGSFNYLSLSLPVEALHYGADKENEDYTKAIKYGGRTVVKELKIPFVDSEAGILDAGALAGGIKDGLEKNSQVDSDYKNKLTTFGSARFGRYMVEGEPKAEFTLGGTS